MRPEHPPVVPQMEALAIGAVAIMRWHSPPNDHRGVITKLPNGHIHMVVNAADQNGTTSRPRTWAGARATLEIVDQPRAAGFLMLIAHDQRAKAIRLLDLEP